MATALTGPRQASAHDESTLARPCSVFVVHPSGVLTDMRAHGDGLLAYRYIRELARRGHRVAVACEEIDLTCPVPPNVTLHRLPLRSEPGSLARRFEYAWKMRRLFRRLDAIERFDVAHQLNPVFAGLSLGLVGIDVPLVLGPYVAHWPSPQPTRLAARMRDTLNALQQRFASAILVSGAAARARVVSGRIAADSVYAVPYGVDLEMFAHVPPPSGEPAILFMAGFGVKKGVLVLIEAFERVAARVADVRLVIAGDGPEREAVKAAAAKSAYAHRIRFLGAVPRADVPSVFAACTVYCLPSFGEPYGMTLVEAMTTGRPVVATGAGGPADLVDPRGGILVPPGDSAALAESLVALLTDPARRLAMGEYNREAMVAYGWPAVIDRLEAVYADVITGRPRPHSDSSRSAR